jgi:hypothetical protein
MGRIVKPRAGLGRSAQEAGMRLGALVGGALKGHRKKSPEPPQVDPKENAHGLKKRKKEKGREDSTVCIIRTYV